MKTLLVILLFGLCAGACGNDDDIGDCDGEEIWTCEECISFSSAGVYEGSHSTKVPCGVDESEAVSIIEEDCAEVLQALESSASCTCTSSSCHPGRSDD